MKETSKIIKVVDMLQERDMCGEFEFDFVNNWKPV